jgi:hypothetical protein
VGAVSAEMFTSNNASVAVLSSDSDFTNPLKSRSRRNLQEIQNAIAQNFGTRLWTSCTQLKTKQIKARKKG